MIGRSPPEWQLVICEFKMGLLPECEFMKSDESGWRCECVENGRNGTFPASCDSILVVTEPSWCTLLVCEFIIGRLPELKCISCWRDGRGLNGACGGLCEFVFECPSHRPESRFGRWLVDCKTVTESGCIWISWEFMMGASLGYMLFASVGLKGLRGRCRLEAPSKFSDSCLANACVDVDEADLASHSFLFAIVYRESWKTRLIGTYGVNDQKNTKN